jgi:hypothetical protein
MPSAWINHSPIAPDQQNGVGYSLSIFFWHPSEEIIIFVTKILIKKDN